MKESLGNGEIISACTTPEVGVLESYTPVSDGVGLRIIDFSPPALSPEAPTLLFVAGWISMISAWKEVLQVLTPRFRTLYLETREKRSSRVDWNRSPEFSIHRMTRDLHEILETLLPPDRPFCLAGSSLGSTVILDYLSQGLRRPCLSVVIAPNAQIGIPRWFYPLARLIPPSAYGLVRGPIKWHIRRHRIDNAREREQAVKYERSLDEACPRRLKASAMTMKGYTLWPKLSSITTPVIIIGASTDKLHDAREMERMATLIPDSRLVMMASNRETHSATAGRFISEHIENLQTLRPL